MKSLFTSKFILTGLCGLVLFSSPAFSSDDQSQNNDPKAIKEVAKFLKHDVHSLTREVGVFVSTNVLTSRRQSVNYGPAVNDYFNKPRGNVLKGYVNVLNFNNYALFLPFKKGTKYFDFTSEVEFPHSFKAKLSKLGCEASSMVAMNDYCRDLLDEIRVILKVQVAITDQSPREFLCPSKLTERVDIFSDAAIDLNKIKELTKKDTLYFGFYQSELGYREQSASTEWAKQNIFGCDLGKNLGNVKFDSGSIVGGNSGNDPEAIKDEGERKSILKERRAENLKAVGEETKPYDQELANILWTDNEKEQIKKTIDLFRTVVTSQKEDLFVFKKASEILDDGYELDDWKESLKFKFGILLRKFQSGTTGDILDSLWSGLPDPSEAFFVIKIPKGTKVLEPNYGSTAFQNVMAGAGCDYSSLLSNVGKCRIILDKILKELKISVLKRDLRQDRRRITRQCSLNNSLYSVMDPSLINKAALIRLDDKDQKLQELAQKLEKLNSLGYSGNEISELSPEAKISLNWALKKHLAFCADIKNIHILKEMPNLAKAVIANTFILPKDTYGFHWQRQDSVLWDGKLPTGPTDYQIKEYIRYSTTRFWVSRYGGGSGGMGLYFAIDPESSSYNYGNTLLKVTLRKGTRYFNYSGGLSMVPFPNEVLDEMKTQGCSAANLKGVYYSEDQSCEKVAMALTKDLKISFVIFAFGGVLPRTCQRSSTGQAFVVFDSNAIIPEKSIVISGNGDLGISDSFKKEAAMLTRFQMGYWRNKGILNGLSVTDEEFNKWVHDGFYGCDYDPFSIHEIN